MTARPLTAAQIALIEALHNGASLRCMGVNLWLLRPVSGRGRRVFAGTAKSLIERGLIAVSGHDHSDTIYSLTAVEEAA